MENEKLTSNIIFPGTFALFRVCLFVIVLFVSVSFGQKIIITTNEPNTISVPNAATISDNEWKVLTDALTAENWDKAAFYASGLLNRLKADNEQKQVARLRYFYLYSLAGKIHKALLAGKKTDEELAWRELDKVVNELIGKEFLLPPREYRVDCQKALNYICSVKDNEKAFRTTATNKEGNSIHSFDYVVLEKKVDLKEYAERQQIFLGGTLKKVEFNDEFSDKQPWVMYLIFEKGFVRVVLNE